MFKIRTSAPTSWNKIYNNANNGGISWCINGRPMNGISNVLANCVGYACSRFNEIYNELTGFTGMKYQALCCNAEDFWEVAANLGLKRGQTPQAGSIMCWEGLGDLAGHVAIVEKVINNNQVYTSESGYDSAFFWNSTRYNDGNWGAGGNYRFKGFIYNPAVKVDPPKQTIVVDGLWGKYTTKAAQKVYKTTVDGIVSNQLISNKKYCINCQKTSFQWNDKASGSAVIKVMQKKLGVKVDGQLGKVTIKAMQKALGVTVDGFCGQQTVTAFQKWLNKKL